VPVGSMPSRAPSWVHVDEFLASLPVQTLDRMVGNAVPFAVPSGEICFRATDNPSRAGIVVDGLARIYLAAADGRRLTYRYARPGSMIGVTTALLGEPTPLNVQAVTDCQILEVSLPVIAEIGREDAVFSWKLALEGNRRLLDAIELLADATFGTVRGRLARHMLDLVDHVDAEGKLIVEATNQELADSIGTVREVVARHLSDLRDGGCISTERGRITILDPEALAENAGQWMPRHPSR
jgi:CRP/FNR family transcriptional regulator, cyclic AMP receptor protein